MSFINRAGFIIGTLALCTTAVMARAEVDVVVSAKNPITKLSKAQVAAIFLGNTSRFPDGSQAVPIDQIEGAAVRDEFYREFTGKSPAQIKAHWSKIIFTGRGQPPREVSSSVELKKLLANNPHAIGYIEPGQVDDGVKVLLVQ